MKSEFYVFCLSFYLQPTTYFEPPLPPVSTIHATCSLVRDVIPLRRQDSPDSGIGKNFICFDSCHLNPCFTILSSLSTVESQNSPLSAIPPDPHQQTYIPVSMPAVTTSSVSSMSPSPVPVTSSYVLNNNNNDIVRLVEELEETHPSTPPLSATPPSNEVQIRVLYGSIPVHVENVVLNSGCRIYFDPCNIPPPSIQDTRKLFGPPEAHQIALPSSHPDPLAKQLFQAMHRGLLIEMIGGDIFATPLCRTVVYYSPDSTSQSYPLEKEQRAKVFDYQQAFRPALEHFALGHGPMPNPSVLFSLGQSWGPGRHVARNLITVVVTHSQAKHEVDAFGLPHALAQDLLVDIPETVEIDQANCRDIEAEAFLSQFLAVN